MAVGQCKGIKSLTFGPSRLASCFTPELSVGIAKLTLVCIKGQLLSLLAWLLLFSVPEIDPKDIHIRHAYVKLLT